MRHRSYINFGQQLDCPGFINICRLTNLNQTFKEMSPPTALGRSRPLSCNSLGFCEWQALAFILCEREFADKKQFSPHVRQVILAPVAGVPAGF